MAKVKLKIALFGIFGVGNFGNEASLSAMIQQVRQRLPNADIFCICPEPLNVAIEHEIEAKEIGFKFRNRRNILIMRCIRIIRRISDLFGLLLLFNAIRAFQILRNVNLFIVPGTGALDDFGAGPWTLPFDLLIWCTAARLRKAKVYFCNVGAGPIENLLSRWFIKIPVRKAYYRSFRDNISKDFVRSLGIDVNEDHVVPDLVFSLTETRFEQKYGSKKNKITVSVGVMAYYGWDNQREKGLVVYETYINKITIFIIWLLKNDYAVHLVIGETTDQQAVDDILSRIAQIAKSYLKDIVSNPVTSFNGLLKEMSTTDVVVATRYHNIVCALMLEKPVISLGYAKKNEVLLKGVKLDKYCQHIERIDIETLKLNFYEVVQHREILSKRIQKRNKRFRKILEDQFLKMFSSMQ